MSFLLVGHTHEDIDQMFSSVAQRFSQHDAKTLPELLEENKDSYTLRVAVERLSAIFDVKEWMAGSIEGVSIRSYPTTPPRTLTENYVT